MRSFALSQCRRTSPHDVTARRHGIHAIYSPEIGSTFLAFLAFFFFFFLAFGSSHCSSFPSIYN